MVKNWSALIIGIVVSIYWCRVMVMVSQSRRNSGHGANFVPPEPLGRALRLLWTPVILLWIFLPFVAFVAKSPNRFSPVIRPIVAVHPVPMLVGVAAAGVAVLCLLATFICWRQMGRNWRMGIDPNDRTQLVCDGPFAYVRHPIYALSSILMLCTMVAVSSVLMLVVGVIHLLLLQWEARREERFLCQLHGEQYIRYSRLTGRFFPRSLRPYGSSLTDSTGFDMSGTSRSISRL